jgi:hypothetical protein
MSSYRVCYWRETQHTQQFRWHVRATNGRIVAASGEAYRRRVDMLRLIARLFPTLAVEEVAAPSHGGGK